MVDLSDLPPEVLEILFEFLEPTSLGDVAECCTKFKEIVENSEKLTKKFTLYMRYPLDLNTFSATIVRSSRRYRKLLIIKSRDQGINNLIDPSIRLMFERLGDSIHYLKIDWTNASRVREASMFEIMNRRARARELGGHVGNDNVVGWQAQATVTAREDIYLEFVNLIRRFSNLQKLSMYNVHLERSRQPNEPALQFPHLKWLSYKHCDAFCFDVLSSCVNLDRIDVIEPWWNTRSPGIDNFETFLVSQISLKHLRMIGFQYPRLFQVDRTNQIRFKLESLKLRGLFFADKNIAHNFFRSQNELKRVDFQLQNEKVRCIDEMLWYNNIIKSIIGSNNTHLEELKIEKMRYRIEDYQFLANTVNLHVKRLSFNVSSEDKSSDLFKIFIRMFPNLEEVEFKVENKSEDTDSGICFDDGTVLERVNTLVIRNSSVRSLVNVYAGSLKFFEYVPGKTGEFIDDYFGGFFHRQ